MTYRRFSAAWVLIFATIAALNVYGSPKASAQSRVTQVVATEQARLLEEQQFIVLARAVGGPWASPFWLGTGDFKTLVLPARATPYTLQDLAVIAPGLVVRQRDESIEVRCRITVGPGAVLDLVGPTTHLVFAYTASGFSALTSVGGTILAARTQQTPLQITTKKLTPSSGNLARPYLRFLGGTVDLRYVDIADLGFSSNFTSGLAFSGSDNPNFGTVRAAKPAVLRHRLEAMTAKINAQPTVATGPTPSSLPPAPPALISVRLDHVTEKRGAQGALFINAEGGKITNSSFSNNRGSGVVAHFNVHDLVMDHVTTSHNGRHGIALERAVTSAALSNCTASDNDGYGMWLSGRPLEKTRGSGVPFDSYGSNTVIRATAINNGRGGIKIAGGISVGVTDSTISGEATGIGVSGPASLIALEGNHLSAVHGKAISLGHFVVDATIANNMIANTETGIFLSSSSATITANTLTTITKVGIMVTGRARPTLLRLNSISGRGFKAINTGHATGVRSVYSNDTSGWSSAGLVSPLSQQIRRPATLMWTGILSTFVVARLLSRRRRRLARTARAELRGSK